MIQRIPHLFLRRWTLALSFLWFACEPGTGVDVGNGTNPAGNEVVEPESFASVPPGVETYIATGESCCGEDPHPVHGIEVTDGSFILCGKSVDSGGEIDGFLVKFKAPFPGGSVFIEDESNPLLGWSATFGKPGHRDGANHVAATESALFVAGFEETNTGTVHASLRKYDLESGERMWSALFPSSKAATDSAFESIQRTADGGMVVGGFENGNQGGIEGFKSYGNPTSGEARLMVFSPDQLESEIAPDAPSWTRTYTQAGSMRQLRQLPQGDWVFLAAPPEEEGSYRVVRAKSDGDPIWEVQLESHGEATDLAVVTYSGQPSALAVSGHVHGGEGIDGSITQMSLSGEVLWSKTVGNPVGGKGEFAGLGAGEPALIFDECWGVTGDDAGGIVVACGTGIEGCDELDSGSPLLAQCQADPRTKWRGMLLGLNAEGEERWSRTDSFQFPGEKEVAASASEYVIRTQSGGFASVVDQDFGIGLLLTLPPE